MCLSSIDEFSTIAGDIDRPNVPAPDRRSLAQMCLSSIDAPSPNCALYVPHAGTRLSRAPCSFLPAQ